VLREKRIPFELKLKEEDFDPFYSSKNMERLKKSIEQMEKTGGTIHEVNYDQGEKK
jgi:DNA-damage-inducible protein J